VSRAFVLCLVLSLSAIGCSSSEQQPAPAAHDHGAHDHASHDHGSHAHGTAPTGADHHAPVAIENDPICGMKATPSWTLSAMEAGQRFPFCSASCKAKFEKDPHKIGQAFFDKNCGCKATMPDCDCGHCTGTFEPCPCG
jgi:YHS domain-containing protein